MCGYFVVFSFCVLACCSAPTEAAARAQVAQCRAPGQGCACWAQRGLLSRHQNRRSKACCMGRTRKVIFMKETAAPWHGRKKGTKFLLWRDEQHNTAGPRDTIWILHKGERIAGYRRICCRITSVQETTVEGCLNFRGCETLRSFPNHEWPWR